MKWPSKNQLKSLKYTTFQKTANIAGLKGTFGISHSRTYWMNLAPYLKNTQKINGFLAYSKPPCSLRHSSTHDSHETFS